ncbi:MAG: MFS transporter [Myxococcales bacterium]|nr:MFS transporter [Myxococcales bacterium]
MTTRAKLWLLCSLYFSQGLPFGFFTLAVPVVLRNQGVSLEGVGASSLLLLPWALKFLWSPLVDRTGRRSRWILILQAVSVCLFVALGVLPQDRSTELLMLGMVLSAWLAATQDIATDGLATSLLSAEERGLGNGLQVAGYRLGMIVGGGGLLVLFARGGWSLTFLAMAVLLALASGPLLATTTLPPSPATALRLRDVLASGLRPGMAGWMGLLAVYKGGQSMASAMVRPYLVDGGWSLDGLGATLGLLGSTVGLLGAVLGGLMVHRLGRRGGLVAFGLLQTASVAAIAMVAALGFTGTGFMVAALGEDFASGTATAVLFTSMMDRCRLGLESTDYTVQASWVVIWVGVASAVSGAVAGSLGYTACFALATVASLGAVALVPWVVVPEPARAPDGS